MLALFNPCYGIHNSIQESFYKFSPSLNCKSRKESKVFLVFLKYIFSFLKALVVVWPLPTATSREKDLVTNFGRTQCITYQLTQKIASKSFLKIGRKTKKIKKKIGHNFFDDFRKKCFIVFCSLD